MNNIVEYIYYLFLIIIFFYYGLFLSILIDHIFPDMEHDYPEYLTLIETILELLFVYAIYFIFRRYINNIINFFINKPSFVYLDTLLLLAFSFGIYRHLRKSTIKIDYFKQKYLINNIKNFKIYKYYMNIINKKNKN